MLLFNCATEVCTNFSASSKGLSNVGLVIKNNKNFPLDKTSCTQRSTMKKTIDGILKYSIKVSFFVTFIFFSLQSIDSYLKGEVIFENINEYNDNLVFPSLTICPKPKEAFIYLKTDQIAADLNISNERSFNGKLIAMVRGHKDPLSFIKNYTFSKEEIFPEGNLSTSSSSFT